MFKLIGLHDITVIEMWTLIVAATAIALIVGWVIDWIAGDMGFGVVGNAVICLAGCFVGLILFRSYVAEVAVSRLPTMMAVACVSVVVHFLLLIGLRRSLRL